MVYGRGELMIAVLVETMRREGYEIALGNPEVVVREEDGQKLEPTERVVIDVPDEYVGIVTSRSASAAGAWTRCTTSASAARASSSSARRAGSSASARSS